MKKYWTVITLGWQDSLAYRFNALVWVLYSVLPSLTLMLVWIAAYRGDAARNVGGYNLSQMMTYYLLVTAISVVITPNFEWETAQLIRDGKITPFLVRPVGFFGYKLAQETAYQIIKSVMFLPALALLIYLFRGYIALPAIDTMRGVLVLCSLLAAYMLLTQLKFLLGISAFWLAEVGGLLEIFNTLVSVLGGRWLPLSLLPPWLRTISEASPFAATYSFPVELLTAHLNSQQIALGFLHQIVWIGLLALATRFAWQRGLLAYEAYGG
jgi:ABC-2 type transport system permease protein